ncbi:MAG: Gfo/Idh/MocA family oxidoreductase [Planctomycetes bacterium]|nr:Gfo/Idh/MocA family oxidoreductase [Planctomycetota bacterium]
MSKKRSIARIGIIGGGKFGEMHLRAFTQLERDGQAKLVALCDINEELLAKRHREYGVKGYTDYAEMLAKEDLDGVTVVTPDHLHRRFVVGCLKAGKHVLVEKPLDVTVEGCDEMIAEADKAGRILQVDFHKRFDPYHRQLAARVAAGAIGNPLYGYAWMEDRIEVPRDWFPHWAPQSSPFWFLGVHMVDLIRFCTRAKGVSVFASGAKKKLASLGIDAWDCVNARIVFDDGSTFAVDTSWVLPDRFEAVVNQGIRIVGTEGAIEVDSQNRGAEACTAAEGQQTWNLGFFLEERDKDGSTRWSGYGIESIADFAHNVNFLLRGGSLEQLAGKFVDGREAREATKIAVAAHESLATGKLVACSA